VADRISRPPVRLAAGLPDGTLCGITSGEHRYWTEDPWDEPEPRWAYVRYGRKGWQRGDHSGAEQATLEVLEFEPEPDPAGVVARVKELREGRDAQLPSDDPADGQADRRLALELAVMVWCGEQPGEPRDVWEDYFGEGAPAGPLGADLVHLAEFAGHHAIEVTVRDDRGPDDEDSGPAEGDAV